MNSILKRLLLAAACLGTTLPIFACDVTIANASNPYAIDQEAASAPPGTVICVGPGTYKPIRLDAAGGSAPRGEPGAWIVIRNLNSQRPKILASVVNNRPRHGISLTGTSASDAPRYVEIRGFEIVSDYEQRTGGKVTDKSGHGITVSNYAHHIRLIDNIVRGFPSNGITVIGADFIHIENNEIYNNARWHRYQSSGISLSGLYTTDDAYNYDFPASRDGVDFHVVIRGNRVHHNEVRVNGPSQWAWGDLNNPGVTDGNCIIMDHAGEPDLPGGGIGYYWGTTLIENNVCHHNGARGIHISNTDSVWVINNTLYHNGQTPTCPEGTRNPNVCSDGPFSELYVQSKRQLGGNSYFWMTDLYFYNNLVVPDPTAATLALTATNNLWSYTDHPGAVFSNNMYTSSKRFYNDRAANQDYAELWTVNQLKLKNSGGYNFDIYSNSAAAHKGASWMSPSVDYDGNPFHNSPAVGAYAY